MNKKVVQSLIGAFEKCNIDDIIGNSDLMEESIEEVLDPGDGSWMDELFVNFNKNYE